VRKYLTSRKIVLTVLGVVGVLLVNAWGFSPERAELITRGIEVLISVLVGSIALEDGLGRVAELLRQWVGSVVK